MKHLIFLIPIIAILIKPLNLRATEFKAGDEVRITKKSNGDLYATGGSITTNAVINGDLIAAGGDISINDSVNEDLTVAGGQIDIRNYVGDDIRAAGGKLVISGYVGGDLIVAGGNIIIEKQAVINGDLIASGGQVKIYGVINGNAKVQAGTLIFHGIIEGSANLKGGKGEISGSIDSASTISFEELKLTQSAKFYGNVKYWQRNNEMNWDDHLRNEATATFDPSLDMTDSFQVFGLGLIGFLVFWVFSILVGLLIILILQLFFSNQIEKVAKTFGTNTLKSLIIGALYFGVIPLVIIFLCLTIIGIPLGLFTLAFYLFSLWFAKSITSTIITNWLNRRLNFNWSNGIVILFAFLVLISIKLINLIPVIGWFISFVIISSGLGAIFLNLYNQKAEN